MTSELLPNAEELSLWMLATAKHSFHVEYFMERLHIGTSFDPERPHDLKGPGNKFEWDVMKGFALQYREPKVDFKTYIEPALNLHRQQYHHRMWNNPSPLDITKKIPEAEDVDMYVGAIDAVCSLLENRAYQGGVHSYESIEEITLKNPPHKRPWMFNIIRRMRECTEYQKIFDRPHLEFIDSIENFDFWPNIGVNLVTYRRIIEKTRETTEMLRNKGYEIGGKK